MTDWVWSELRTAVIECRLLPGQPLREVPLAEQLGVSKTPIREALKRLEQEGFVETTSFKGAVVAGYSRRDLTELYELRILLEQAAARAAAERATDDVRQCLTDMVALSRALRERGNLVRLAELYGEFDSVIHAQVDNRRIQALSESVRCHMVRAGNLMANSPRCVEASVEEHAGIVEAIVRRDGAAAETRTREHILGVLADQLALQGDLAL